MSNDREARLLALKTRIDAIHEIVLRALKTHDDAAMDRAMNEQHQVMQEYTALLNQKRAETN